MQWEESMSLAILPKSPAKIKKQSDKKKSTGVAFSPEEHWIRQPPSMRHGYGLDKKDSNELSLFNDYLGKNSVLKFTHE